MKMAVWVGDPLFVAFLIKRTAGVILAQETSGASSIA